MAPLQILTLNVWGLWLVSKKRYNRILHLAEFLANDAEEKHRLDVVLLQEVWVDDDIQVLTSAARLGGLPYAMHFRSGVFGSGLLTLSRYPITEAQFHQYNCAGDPAALGCGDYLAGKGVGWARLASPAGPLDVFNTHLHANYAHKYDKAGSNAGRAGSDGTTSSSSDLPPPAVDEFAAFRMAQVLELCRFVQYVTRGSQPAGVGTVLGGDLNCGPATLEHAVLRALLPHLRDSWVEAHGASEAGHTCKAADNTFRPRRQLPSRIDYVFSSLRVAACKIALKRTPEGHSYSDHFAVHTTLELPTASAATTATTATSSSAAAVPPERLAAVLGAAGGVIGGGLDRAAQSSAGHLLMAIILLIQAACLCAFEPVMSYLDRPLNPLLRPLLPCAVLLMAAAGGVLGLTGLVADAGQTRALQQAHVQVDVLLGRTAAAGEGEQQQKEQQQHQGGGRGSGRQGGR